MKPEILPTKEALRRCELEQIICDGKKAFLEVGSALAEIKRNRLYRSTHASFDEYCLEAWGFAKSYANYLVSGAEAVKSLPAEMATIVATESQAREIAKVEPARRESVLTEAAKRGPVTAKSIKAVADETDPDEPERPHIITHESPDMEPVVSDLDVVIEDIKVILDKILRKDFDKADLIAVALELKKAARKIETVAATAS